MNRTTISSKKINFITSLVMAVVILVLSPISVLAYSPAPTYQLQDEQVGLMGETIKDYYGYDIIQDVYDPFLEYGTAHDIFIAADGQVYIQNDSDPQMERVICFHDWKDGTTVGHTKNDDGSCVVYYYTCQYCTICGSAKNVKYVGEYHYAQCPH